MNKAILRVSNSPRGRGVLCFLRTSMAGASKKARRGDRDLKRFIRPQTNHVAPAVALNKLSGQTNPHERRRAFLHASTFAIAMAHEDSACGQGPWILDLGTWNLEFGTWNLELGTWNFSIIERLNGYLIKRYLWSVEKPGRILRIHAITVVISTGLMAAKFLAWYLTGSNAILTDALESIVNVLAGAFAWYSLWLSFKPRDHDHPYGHGKIEFISATLEGSLILIAGLSIFFKSAYNFFFPQEIHEISTGIWLVAGAGLINFMMGLYLRKKGEKSGSMTLKANGQHLLSDAWSSLGLLVGLFLLWISGEVWVDNVLGLLFGAYIAWVALGILRKSVAGIMDEADFALLEELVAYINTRRKKQWIDIHNLRVIQYGRMLHIDCHITLPWYYSLQEAHDAIKDVDQTIYEKYQEVELFIHMDPCIPHSCRICSIEDCPVRQKPFEATQEWDVATLLKNQKHGEL